MITFFDTVLTNNVTLGMEKGTNVGDHDLNLQRHWEKCISLKASENVYIGL